MTLPVAQTSQAFCDVSALEAGIIEMREELYITDGQPGKYNSNPSLSFLIRHTTKGQNFIFDLGIRRDWENYPPPIVELIKDEFKVGIPQNVIESLAKGMLSPEDIMHVCISHCHFDHIGDPSPFTKSVFLLGGESQKCFNPGYPSDPDGYPPYFIPQDRALYFDVAKWQPLGPFPRALDFYNDGSLYIIDAPGHMLGHINLLARTSADGAWIYLAGDSAHHWNLLTGKSEIFDEHRNGEHICAHDDKEAAKEHLRCIRRLLEMPRVRVILAHDGPWYKENKGGPAFWPGKIPSL